MAAGLPVVTTTVGDFDTLITPGVNGYLVAPGDARALEERLESLSADADLRDRIGAAGLRTVRERFSLAGMVRNLEAYYDEALAGAARAGKIISGYGA
jgi:glycosyltransferase involved in cell wall biosynthesis